MCCSAPESSDKVPIPLVSPAKGKANKKVSLDYKYRGFKDSNRLLQAFII